MPSSTRSETVTLRRVLVEFGPTLLVEDADCRLLVVPTGSDAEKLESLAALMADFDLDSVDDLTAAMAALVRAARDEHGQVHEAFVQSAWAMLRERKSESERCRRCGSLREAASTLNSEFSPFDLEDDSDPFRRESGS